MQSKGFRLIFALLFFVFFLAYPKPTLAAGEFSTSYNVTYDIDSSGTTSVTEKVTLKNLTDRYFASSFTLTIGATQVSEVVAFDSGGKLETIVEPISPNKQKITVKFVTQIAGKDKEYTWTLKFKSTDFAQKTGKIWQVSVPKIVSTPDLNTYALNLSVPVGFGDPSVILPEPASQSETAGKLEFKFNKEQLLETGILATFGAEQVFDYQLLYHLENNSILPRIMQVALPPNTNYQTVSIDDISPSPENVVTDRDGNFTATFKLERLQKLDVKARGLVRLQINPSARPNSLTPEDQNLYTSQNKYWEKDNPLVKLRLLEILKDSPTYNLDKARLIYAYVVKELEFDSKKLENQDFERLGSITVLSNPQSALANEFVDLFVSLVRAAGIPARALAGFGYSGNQALRPSSLQGGLHAWVQIYDPRYGWVMVDPTWEHTTGGADYFSKFDLNHIVFSVRGADSTGSQLPAQTFVSISERHLEEIPNLSAKINIPDVIYGIIPTTTQVSIINSGNSAYASSSIKISSSRLKLSLRGHPNLQANSSVSTATIPPKGHLDYKFSLSAHVFFRPFTEKIFIEIGDKKFEKNIEVLPFFKAELFPFLVGGSVLVIVLSYLGVLVLYLKKGRLLTPFPGKSAKGSKKPPGKKKK